MQTIIVLFVILCLCAAGSDGPWFPWINLGATGCIFIICACSAIFVVKDNL